MTYLLNDTIECALLMKGDSSWDYYLVPASKPFVYSVAREGSGASNSVFGSLDYFKRIKGYKEETK